MAIPLAYAASRTRRTRPTLPFGWGAATVLIVGAVLLIAGILIILYAFIGLFTSILSSALDSSQSPSGTVLGIFNGFFGAMVLFVVGGVLAGVGGWLVRLWWIFLLVGAVTAPERAGNTVQDREPAAPPEIKVRCRTCGHLNPQEARFCLACGQAI